MDRPPQQKQRRHDLTPSEHASELRERGTVSFQKEFEEIARNEHADALASLTREKKMLGLMNLMASEIESLRKEIDELKSFKKEAKENYIAVTGIP